VAQRLLLLYPSSRPIGWALRWAFFTLLIATIAAAVRGFVHVNYLPIVALLAGTLVLAILLRLAVSHFERARPAQNVQVKDAS
jgi:hypothetical protein